MNFIAKIFFCVLIFSITKNSLANTNTWYLDKKISDIKFELPLFMSNDVKGKFNSFEGFVVIDLENKKNNRALFSVKIDSIELNYNKYIDLLLSDIFFNEKKFPIIVIDTKKFEVPKNKNFNQFNIELQIKTNFAPPKKHQQTNVHQ